MNDDFVALYAFNRWANERVLEACRKLTPDQYAEEPVPGWSSIRSTLTHIAIVTDGWLRGIAGETVESFPTEVDLPSVDHSAQLLDRAYKVFDALAPTLTPERLSTLQTLRSRGRKATLPPWVVLRHIVNHATYHRGQIASKLKRFGIEPPVTDMGIWAFEHFPQEP